MTEVICVIERLKRLKDLITREIPANLSPCYKMAHLLPLFENYQISSGGGGKMPQEIIKVGGG